MSASGTDRPERSGGQPDGWAYISEPAERRKEWGDVFFRRNPRPKKYRTYPDLEEWGTYDVIGLLYDRLPLNHLKSPNDLRQFCGDDYLAVIVADGNRIGLASKQWRHSWGEKDPVKKDDESATPFPDWQRALAQEIYGERFFYSMRAAVRRALLPALEETFRGFRGNVCDGYPLTIGAGVVMAAPNLPFHRLHQLAEDLASSAKQLYRGLAGPPTATEAQRSQNAVSVADWMVVTQAWSDDAGDLRKGFERVRYSVACSERAPWQETLALSARPYRILTQQESGTPAKPPDSLQALLLAAEQLGKAISDDDAARSQLLRLAETLREGCLTSRLAFRELAAKTRLALEALGFTDCFSVIAEDHTGKQHLTRIADLIELCEIPRLGRQRSDDR